MAVLSDTSLRPTQALFQGIGRLLRGPRHAPVIPDRDRSAATRTWGPPSPHHDPDGNTPLPADLTRALDALLGPVPGRVSAQVCARIWQAATEGRSGLRIPLGTFEQEIASATREAARQHPVAQDLIHRGYAVVFDAPARQSGEAGWHVSLIVLWACADTQTVETDRLET